VIGCAGDAALASAQAWSRSRRLADRATPQREVAAWPAARDQAGRGVNRRFTTQDARTKPRRPYPTTQPDELLAACRKFCR
jgi:hypothetical protein